MRLVLDTHVVVAAFRSPTGASAALIELALDGSIKLLVTVPLALEYEAVLKRGEHLVATGSTIDQMDRRVRSLVALCDPVYRAFRWRPQLRDPADEMVLEQPLMAALTCWSLSISAILERLRRHSGLSASYPALPFRG